MKLMVNESKLKFPQNLKEVMKEEADVNVKVWLVEEVRQKV